MYKKILLSSAIAVAMGTAGVAQAAVVIDNDADDALVYASEITVDGTNGTGLADNGSNQALSAELGFTINAGTTRYIRVDLGSDAIFDGAPTIAVADTSGGNGAFSGSPVSAGGDDASFVIFEVTAASGGTDQDLASNDVVTVTPGTGITVFGKDAVTAQYRLYETATAAASEGASLAAASDTVYKFDAALTTSVLDASEDQIDVATNSTEFVGGLSSPIANVSLGAKTDVLWSDGDQSLLSDLVTGDTKLVINGDFSGALDANGDLDNTKVVGGAPLGNADALTASSATWDIGQAALGNINADPITGVTITYTVDGDTTIATGTYNGLYDVTAATGADTADVTLANLSDLEKNGASTDLNLVLTPSDEGGAFRNFVRITNTSGITGDVFITLRNDVGDSVGFALGAVEGQQSELAGQNSTSLINVDALFDAAVAADSSFAVGQDGRNKLRMTVEGNFTSITADNVSVSRDNQSFSTFQ